MSETQLKNKYMSILKSMINCVETMNDEFDRSRQVYKIFDYIIKYRILEYNFITTKFKNDLFNKLIKFENQDVPGKFNPREWVPIAKRILFHV